MPEFSSAIVCRGNIPVSRTFGLCVKDIHRKKLQAGNCAKECQLNLAKPRKVKQLSKKPIVKSVKHGFLPTH